jgi:hypothetical protein
MSRKSYIQIGGILYEKSSLAAEEARCATVRGDLPDFVSPIDGKTYSGRAGLRDHCQRHNVVPTEELRGLPPKPMNLNLEPSQQQRQQTKQVIADIMNSRGYFRGR